MKDLHELTDLQLSIMHEIWRRDRATVTDVHEALIDATGLAKKTVGTMMARLEKQGFLTHFVEGREYVYEAAVTRQEVRRAKVHNVLDGLFGGSLPSMVSHALEAGEVAANDLERVRQMLNEWEQRELAEDVAGSTSKGGSRE
ncbi:MAG: BlaI/MecI/CopY family transcriptional regulator [Acidobacteria bacterium]|nr:BlaI/MecI/CopY family transcriptional regulator [Acidobacteriota bacterium]